MKHITSIILAVLLVTTTAWAYDLTYYGPIGAKETKSIRVSLPEGKLAVEVFSSAGGKLNCQFSSSYGGVVFEQTNVTKCTSNVVVKSSTDINVSVTNLDSKESDYKIWVHDLK